MIANAAIKSRVMNMTKVKPLYSIAIVSFRQIKTVYKLMYMRFNILFQKTGVLIMINRAKRVKLLLITTIAMYFPSESSGDPFKVLNIIELRPA